MLILIEGKLGSSLLYPHANFLSTHLGFHINDSPSLETSLFYSHIMASDLVELINEYYEARKPYSQLIRESYATSSSQRPTTESNNSTAESSDMVQSQQEPQFSIPPRIPKEEMSDVLKKLETIKIEYTQGDRSTGKAMADKKGKAPVGKT